MSVKVGKVAKVVYGTYTVAEQGTYTLSGFTRKALDKTAFTDDIEKFVFGVGNGGTISFSGNYDPTDSTGQVMIDSACINASTLISNQLKFYIDNTSYLCLTSGGEYLVTKCKAIKFDKAGIGTIDFEVQISGGSVTVV